MLFTNLDITFKYNAGAETRALVANKIEFGLRLFGHIDELLDYTLSEDYEEARQTIEVLIKLSREDSNWMADFLTANDKQIIIDNTTYNVANEKMSSDFPLFKGMNIGTFPRLVFRRKEVGVLDPSVQVAQNDPNA